MKYIPSNPDNIRRLDVHRDLNAIADLIELCFATHMDSDGREYLRQIRRAANDHDYLRWTDGPGERISLPLHGYVWEEDYRVVGNLSLIPFFWRARWLYMIANVAVHPDYRQRGIAKKLTQKALQHIRERNAQSAWLQVRNDNSVAYQLYLSLGFIERAWRTTWQSSPNTISLSEPQPGISIQARRNEDWPRQRAMLQEIYPDEVAWNLGFQATQFAPSIWRSFLRLIHGDSIEHWVVRSYRELIGAVTWEPGRYNMDTLWIATSTVWEDLAIQSLLPYIRRGMTNEHILSVNYPAGHAENAFKDAGFQKHNTLIWMELRF